MTDHPPAETPTSIIRIVSWPTRSDAPVTADTSLTEADPAELAQFARNYADVPLLDLMRRLRLAEWNAAEYQRQAEEWQATARRMPPLHKIQEMDARHKRITSLLAEPGRISRALLAAALAESEDTWNARRETS